MIGSLQLDADELDEYAPIIMLNRQLEIKRKMLEDIKAQELQMRKQLEAIIAEEQAQVTKINHELKKHQTQLKVLQSFMK